MLASQRRLFAIAGVLIVILVLAGPTLGHQLPRFPQTLRSVLPVLASHPYLVATGDSIAEGHGQPNGYHSFYHQGPSGNIEHEIWFQLSQRVPGLTYENHAMGGQTCEWVAKTGVMSALAAQPRVIVVHCGVNDVLRGRTWPQVEGDLDAIRSSLRGQVLLVDEILPWTAGNDEQAETIRLWNSNLVDWASRSGTVLVPTHDRMAQLRPTTGQLDDLRVEYDDGSGVHLSIAGVKQMAEIERDSLAAHALLPVP